MIEVKILNAAECSNLEVPPGTIKLYDPSGQWDIKLNENHRVHPDRKDISWSDKARYYKLPVYRVKQLLESGQLVHCDLLFSKAQNLHALYMQTLPKKDIEGMYEVSAKYERNLQISLALSSKQGKYWTLIKNKKLLAERLELCNIIPGRNPEYQRLSKLIANYWPSSPIDAFAAYMAA